MGLVLLCTTQIMHAQRLCLSQSHPFNPLKRSVDFIEPITIPVVVHILSRNEEQLFSSDEVENQIEMLSADFRRQNVDSLLTPTVFRTVAADTEIEFCLASRGPNGEAVDGIHMMSTEEVEIGITDKFYQSREGGQDAWDASQYLNIWVCEILEDGSIAGFSSLPGKDDDWDGVVIDYRYFGLDSMLHPHHLGRTLTHEVGHWLGLNHTWGDEDNCNVDDGVEDTPIQQQAYSDCPVGDQFSCGSQDMYMNFMDLVNDDCMNLFTLGQKMRMHQTIDLYRSTIRSSQGCELITSTHLVSTEHWIHVYPNPAHDYVQVVCQVSVVCATGLRTGLYDLNGQMHGESSSGIIDVRELPRGLYLMKTQIDGQILTQKILIL